MLSPLFFALTGIHTNLAFHQSGAYLDLIFILLAAVASKWGGALIAARAKGMTWTEACQLGLMVSMALVTTIMATPLMDWVDGAARRRKTTCWPDQ